MTRKPQINIVAGRNVTYAMVNKELVAFRWEATGRWYTAGPGASPIEHDDEATATKSFMSLAFEAAGAS